MLPHSCPRIRGFTDERVGACGACWWGRGAAVLLLVAPAARVEIGVGMGVGIVCF
ncbi:MAG: hypothetical protein R6U13_08240 [Desulfatiglandaceae bacterium]